MTYDVRLFAGMSAFGIGAGTVYWFLTYDPTGTVLLVLFGVAAGIAGVAELVWSRRAGRRRGDGVRGRPEHGSASDAAVGMDTGAAAGEATEPLPRPGWAPLGIALGLGAVALAAAFGPAVAVAGLILTLWGARSWLGAAVRETDDARRAERTADASAAPSRLPEDAGGPS